ncbi:hypothetical protein GF357_04475 [Candidatus Dojkabacteria bacterium]|nr:hypothetical protein [Candidatus Dojkabacteria bacterium]
MFNNEEIFPGASDSIGLNFWMSSVEDGNMSYNFGNYGEVLTNRKNFLESIGIESERLVLMRVRNNDNIRVLSDSEFRAGIAHKKSGVVADAIMVSNSKYFLGLTPADCVPIVVFDRKNGIFALIHGSRFTISHKVVYRVIKKMISDFGSIPAELLLLLGPSAKGKSLKHPKIFLPDDSHLKKWGKFILKTSDGQESYDPVGYTIDQFVHAGGLRKNAFESSIDTVTDKRAFSQYRNRNLPDGDNGRMLFVVN